MTRLTYQVGDIGCAAQPRHPGGALDPSAVGGDPPLTPRSARKAQQPFELRVIDPAFTFTEVFPAGRRKQHSGRVLHPAAAAALRA